MSSLLMRTYQEVGEQRPATLTKQHRKEKRDKIPNVKTSSALRDWCDYPDYEVADKRYCDKYANQNMFMESTVSDEVASASSEAAVVAPSSSNPPPGAYAVMHGRPYQDRRVDAGTTAGTADPSTSAPEELPPIAAEVVEDTQVDISSHIRRVLAENAVQASSVATMDGKVNWPDKGSGIDDEVPRRHWRRLILVFLFLILLAVAAVTAVVVVMFIQDPPTKTTITIVIQLDSHPEETGWYLYRGDQQLVDFPPGTYTGEVKKRINAKADVIIGEELMFILSDSGGNGIDGGFFKIYNAPDTSDPSTVLVEGTGVFTHRVRRYFTAMQQRKEEQCSNENCCISCEVSEWSEWSKCSADCGGGTRSHTRTVTITNNDCGVPCPPLRESQACNAEPCLFDCPDECCGDSECLDDEKCSDGQCEPVCECTCQGTYICDDDCECMCLYECCSNDECNDRERCMDNKCEPLCDCDCPQLYTCNEETCQCVCPYECCSDGECTADEWCSDKTCVLRETPCECNCSEPYTCNDECECVCPDECCSLDDCSGDKFCSDNPSCA